MVLSQSGGQFYFITFQYFQRNEIKISGFKILLKIIKTMFSQVIAFPISLLRNVSVLDESINKHVPLVVFKVYQFLFRYMFICVGSICETVQLKTYESLHTSERFWFVLISWTEKQNSIFTFFKVFCDNFSIATSICNIAFKMFAVSSKIDEVFRFRNSMDSPISRPRDRIEQK